LLGKPKLLLLDEPTEGIQPNIVLDIYLIVELNKSLFISPLHGILISFILFNLQKLSLFSN